VLWDKKLACSGFQSDIEGEPLSSFSQEWLGFSVETFRKLGIAILVVKLSTVVLERTIHPDRCQWRVADLLHVELWSIAILNGCGQLLILIDGIGELVVASRAWRLAAARLVGLQTSLPHRAIHCP
jgi:hypothetical protein